MCISRRIGGVFGSVCCSVVKEGGSLWAFILFKVEVSESPWEKESMGAWFMGTTQRM